MSGQDADKKSTIALWFWSDSVPFPGDSVPSLGIGARVASRLAQVARRALVSQISNMTEVHPEEKF